MLSFLMKRHPIISLNNTSKVKNFTIANLLPLTIIFGSNDIKSVAHDYGFGMLIPEEIPKERTPWKDLVDKDYIDDDNAIDLLDQMLALDQDKRISAAKALEHPFFDGL